MSTFATLSVQKRTATGKGANRRLRDKALIPGVFYTPGGENIPVQIPEAPLMKIFQTLGRTSIFNVEIDDNGKKTVAPVLLWDLEMYPTKNRLQHVDLFGVNLEKEIKVRVPLEYTGTAKGTKLGGVMEVFFEQIDVLCKPLALPKKITIDVTNLEIGNTLRVSDLVMPEGVRSAMEGNNTIVSVETPSGNDEDPAAEANA